jgi:hypothetical protein
MQIPLVLDLWAESRLWRKVTNLNSSFAFTPRNRIRSVSILKTELSQIAFQSLLELPFLDLYTPTKWQKNDMTKIGRPSSPHVQRYYHVSLNSRFASLSRNIPHAAEIKD